MKSLSVVLLVLSSTVLTAASGTPVFHGEISDTQCAMNVHSLSRSHQEMITKKTFGTDSESCARTCVRRGGEWVLRSGDEVYKLKNQDGIVEFSGRKVRITGILNSKTKTIDNYSIENEATAKTAGN
jgi:hypothetical protein